MSIYLSRLTLNPRCREVRQDLGNCHELHRTLLCAFPQAPDKDRAREHFGVLYRVDTDRRGVHVLAQSVHAPDWSRLPSGYLLEREDDQDNPVVRQIDDAYSAINPGRQYIFRLLANPTKKVDTKSGPNGERRNGRRVVLITEEEQIAWLRRKADEGGFALLDVRTTTAGGAGPATIFAPDQHQHTPVGPIADVRTIPGSAVTGRKGEPYAPGPKPYNLTFGSVRFDGHLQVTDVERFRATLVAGIGSAKAYGFGLLSIAPVPTDD